MSEIVDTELLVNCTILAVRRFGLNTIVNSSTLNSLNRSEIISLLSGIIENKDDLDNINDAKWVEICRFLNKIIRLFYVKLILILIYQGFPMLVRIHVNKWLQNLLTHTETPLEYNYTLFRSKWFRTKLLVSDFL